MLRTHEPLVCHKHLGAFKKGHHRSGLIFYLQDVTSFQSSSVLDVSENARTSAGI